MYRAICMFLMKLGFFGYLVFHNAYGSDRSLSCRFRHSTTITHYIRMHSSCQFFILFCSVLLLTNFICRSSIWFGSFLTPQGLGFTTSHYSYNSIFIPISLPIPGFWQGHNIIHAQVPPSYHNTVFMYSISPSYCNGIKFTSMHLYLPITTTTTRRLYYFWLLYYRS